MRLYKECTQLQFRVPGLRSSEDIILELYSDSTEIVLLFFQVQGLRCSGDVDL